MNQRHDIFDSFRRIGFTVNLGLVVGVSIAAWIGACGTDNTPVYAPGAAPTDSGAVTPPVDSGVNVTEAGVHALRVTQTNLVADQQGTNARNVDPNLVNAWGVAFNPVGPIWVANNETGTSTLYDGNGTPQSLVVGIPAPGAPGTSGGRGRGSPTGLVFNTSMSFMGDRFIFATEQGALTGWQADPTALLRADRSSANAIYKGLAIGSTMGDRLFATNFHGGTVDVFDGSYKLMSLPGGFTDPGMAPGYGPFNVAIIDDLVYVSYAQQDSDKEDDVKGPGLGFIDVFDQNGAFQHRLISNGALNAPWAMLKAPDDYGEFAGMLLVGNFGDGLINIYDRNNGTFMGVLADGQNNPIKIEGLWGMAFGNDSPTAPHDALFFAAGPGDEAHGLFGRLDIMR
jgi:uncharacterized protein (TIGR03118 family)